jgi:predicted phage gp36 major capsid-like protein
MATVVRCMIARRSLCEADLTHAACIADRPDVAAGSLSIAFGDFRRGYLIVDRQGVRVLRALYNAKPYVLFYTTKRVGAGCRTLTRSRC